MKQNFKTKLEGKMFFSSVCFGLIIDEFNKLKVQRKIY